MTAPDPTAPPPEDPWRRQDPAPEDPERREDREHPEGSQFAAPDAGYSAYPGAPTTPTSPQAPPGAYPPASPYPATAYPGTTQPQAGSPYQAPAGYGAYGGYGAAPGSYYPGYAPAPKTNGMAIASLVVSLVGVPLLVCYGIGGTIGLLGAILGHVARRQIRTSGEAGDGLALAGVITGWIVGAIGLLSLVAVVIFIVFAATTTTDTGGVLQLLDLGLDLGPDLRLASDEISATAA